MSVAKETAELRKFLRSHIAKDSEEYTHLMTLSGNDILFEIGIFVADVLKRKQAQRKV